SGDVEGAAGVAAGAAGVDERRALRVVERDGSCRGAHGVDEAREFGGVFSARGDGAEQRRQLHVGETAAEDHLHQLAGFLPRERGTVFDGAFEVGLGHRAGTSCWGLGTGKPRPSLSVAAGDLERSPLNYILPSGSNTWSPVPGN